MYNVTLPPALAATASILVGTSLPPILPPELFALPLLPGLLFLLVVGELLLEGGTVLVLLGLSLGGGLVADGEELLHDGAGLLLLAAGDDGATFTLKGMVSTDCAYYSGSSTSQTIDFGTIGIYASDNTGPAAAFDMTAPANVTIDSNLAGCNTSNTVTLSKSDIRGLVNNSSAGYDTNVFQANLPFSVTANYTAGDVGVAGSASATSLVLPTGSNSVSKQHGAWKSAMALNVNIPVPSKSLLAGSYEGDLTVNIAAF